MSQNIGDLKISVLLEVLQAEKNAEKLSTNLKQVETQANKTSKATEKLSTSFISTGTEAGSFGEAVGLVGIGIAGLIAGLGVLSLKSISAGAEFNNLRDNFSGTNSELELFRKATAGTVSDGSLMKLSNYASDLGVNMEDQAKLFSLAEDAADKYGGGVESNFERVIQAADGSAKGLRSVGVAVTDYNKELEKLIASSGKHKDAMTAEEVQAIRLQAIFNLTGTTLETVNNKTADAADRLEQLKIQGEELVTVFGSSLVDAFSETVHSMDVVGNSSVTLKSLMSDLGSAVGGISADIVNAAQDSIFWIGKALDKYLEWSGNADVPHMIDGKVVTKEQFDKEKSDRERVEAGSDRSAQRDRDRKAKEDAEKRPPATNRGGKTSVSNIKEFVSTLTALEKQLTELQDRMGRQTEGENVELFGKKKELEDKIKLIKEINAVGIEAYVIQQRQKEIESIVVEKRRIGPKFGVDAVKNLKFDEPAPEKVVASPKDKLESILGLADQVTSILGLGADNFITKFIGGLQQGVGLVTGIAKILALFGSGGATGIFSLLGFAGGGEVPGSGSGDTVHAMLTPGEYVINKSRASQLGGKFLNWLNGGGTVQGMAPGAFANNGGGGGKQIVEVPYIVSHKVSGSDLKTILTRVEKTTARRSF